MKRTEWFTTMAWAGIFLALFILNRYQRNREPSWIGWVAWEAEAGLEDSTIWREPPPYRRQNPRSWKSYARDSMRTVSVPAFVRSDTVSAKWLAGYWPQWKADRFITQRARWGGMDSAIAAKEDWLDTRWRWEWVVPPRQALPDLELESWYAHPLWRSAQIQSVHRYQSRIRPLRTWEEVFALAPFDSVQQSWIPKYFLLRAPGN